MDKQTFSRYDVLPRQTDSAKGYVVIGVFQWTMTHLAPSTQCAVHIDLESTHTEILK